MLELIKKNPRTSFLGVITLVCLVAILVIHKDWKVEEVMAATIVLSTGVAKLLASDAKAEEKKE